jgi:hypothetical protein
MRSRYLAAQLAFLVVALFAVSCPCAGQCVVEQCHKLGAEVPPCHRRKPTQGDASTEVCKPSLLLAAEVRLYSSHATEQPTGKLLSLIASDLPGLKMLVRLSDSARQPRELSVPEAITLRAPLRI